MASTSTSVSIFESKSVAELIAVCKEHGIRGYSGKKKHELIQLLTATAQPTTATNVIEFAAGGGTKTALSLFSGAGGDTCGLEAAGWNVTHFSEFNTPAINTHKAAFPSSELLSTTDDSNDIKKIPDETFVKLRGGIELIFAGFPCFIAGTHVFTEAGYKPIEEVDWNDQLMTHMGRYQPIVNIQEKLVPTGTNLYKLHIKYHQFPITGTAEHPFYVRTQLGGDIEDGNGLSEPHWKPLHALTPNDYCGTVSATALSAIATHKDQFVEITNEGKHIWWTRVEALIELPITSHPVPVYNFEVAEDNSYVVENAIVHNCQGFSHAGKKRTDDPRNELVHEFVRATRLIQPTWVIGENVRGLLSRKGVFPPNTSPRPVIDIIEELFEGIGYRISYKVVDATEVGVPQKRKRLLIVGHKGDKYPHLNWPSPPPTPPTIRSILTPTLEGAVEVPALYKPSEQPAQFWILTTETTPPSAVQPHPNLLRLVAGIRNLSTREKTAAGHDAKAKITYTEPEGLISFGTRKGSYHGQVLDPDDASKTIICAYNQCPRLFVGLHNPETGKYWVRCLTVGECGQIQGFPADYPWRGSAKDKIVQIGNAVPPPLASTIARLLTTATFHDTPQYETDSTEKDSDSDEDE
jgi:DNA (cytosine-5)-methyltransferase 1